MSEKTPGSLSHEDSTGRQSLSAAEYDTARRRVGEALDSLPEPLRSEALAAYTIVRTEIGELAGSRRYLQRGWDEADLQRQDYETALRLIAGEFPPLPLGDVRHIARAALEGLPVVVGDS